jgi:hypothetical protein
MPYKNCFVEILSRRKKIMDYEGVVLDGDDSEDVQDAWNAVADLATTEVRRTEGAEKLANALPKIITALRKLVR